MHTIARTVLLASLVLSPLTVSADEINCAQIQLDAFLTSSGQIGVQAPTYQGGTDVLFTPVEPGQCFYEGAVESMKASCVSLFEEHPDNPLDGSTKTVALPSGPNCPQELEVAVSKLRKRVRTLRRKLYRRER
jgi:hypothetical protein